MFQPETSPPRSPFYSPSQCRSASPSLTSAVCATAALLCAGATRRTASRRSPPLSALQFASLSLLLEAAVPRSCRCSLRPLQTGRATGQGRRRGSRLGFRVYAPAKALSALSLTSHSALFCLQLLQQSRAVISPNSVSEAAAEALSHVAAHVSERARAAVSGDAHLSQLGDAGLLAAAVMCICRCACSLSRAAAAVCNP
jgi:hypothetical protein